MVLLPEGGAVEVCMVLLPEGGAVEMSPPPVACSAAAPAPTALGPGG